MGYRVAGVHWMPRVPTKAVTTIQGIPQQLEALLVWAFGIEGGDDTYVYIHT